MTVRGGKLALELKSIANRGRLGNCTATVPPMSHALNLSRDSERAAFQNKILAFLQAEIQDKSVGLEMDTPIDSVQVDSVDILNVMFRIEEEFKIEIQMAFDWHFDTVGDLVEALMGFVPPKQ